MFRQTLRLIGTLLGLQFVLGGVAFFLADYRWIAAVVGRAFLVLVAVTGWSFAGEVDQSRWHTVALPLLSAIPPGVVGGYYARYYIALVWLSPCLILMLTAAALLRPLRSAR
jgi:hypothetical protein